MIDPINFTDYRRTTEELEEAILFALLVAGKNALTTARLLDKFLRDYDHIGNSPFEIFSRFELTKLPQLSVALKDYGFGCYNSKAKGIHALVRANLDLRTCTVDDLEKIHGIGMKTSRFFVLHSRKDAKSAPLDVHVLHYLKDLGYDVPKVTPSSKKLYLTIEKICVQLAKQAGKTLAEWDLDVWRIYRAKSAGIQQLGVA